MDTVIDNNPVAKLKRTKLTLTFKPSHLGKHTKEEKDMAYLEAMGLSFLQYIAEKNGVSVGDAAKALIIETAVNVAQSSPEVIDNERGQDGGDNSGEPESPVSKGEPSEIPSEGTGKLASS
jgi:hypothetical protein